MDYYTKPILLEIGRDSRTIYIGGDTQTEIEAKNRWKNMASRWLWSVRIKPITNINTWTSYKIFGVKDAVLHIDTSTDGHARQIIEFFQEFCDDIYVFAYAEGE